MKRRNIFVLLLLLLGGSTLILYGCHKQPTQNPQINSQSEVPPLQQDIDHLGGENSSEDSVVTNDNSESSDSENTISEDTASKDTVSGDITSKDTASEGTDESTKDSETSSDGNKSEANDSETNDSKADDFENESSESDNSENDEFSFKGALFIGDSRTEGLQINTGLTEATFYALRGLAVDTIYTKKFIPAESGDTEKKLTVLDALKEKQFSKIYIMLGVNELGWVLEDCFIEQYSKLIQDIQALQPDAEIVVQSIIPVTSKKSSSNKIYTNEKIERYNEMIITMTEELGVTYADLLPAFADENGALPEEGAYDGVHLTKSYYKKWLEYLRSQKI